LSCDEEKIPRTDFMRPKLGILQNQKLRIQGELVNERKKIISNKIHAASLFHTKNVGL